MLVMIVSDGVSLHTDVMDCSKDLRASTDRENADERTAPKHFVAVVGGAQGTPYNVTTQFAEDGSSVSVNVSPITEGAVGGGNLHIVGFDYTPGAHMARAFFDRDFDCETANSYKMMGAGYGQPYSEEDDQGLDAAVEIVQIEKSTHEGYKLRYHGSQQEVLVRTAMEHQLAAHMLPPEKKDYSNMLRCPMPGTLISVGMSYLIVACTIRCVILHDFV
jgi:hypothetical protein